MRLPGPAVLAVVLLTATAGTALAQSAGDVAAGRDLATKVCAACHVVAVDQSPTPRSSKAPAFAAIAVTRGVTELSLHAFLSTPHPSMPNFILSPAEQDNVIAYILSLRPKK